MGNRFSSTKRRDAPATSAETAAAPEQKTAEEPAVATQPAADAGITQTQEAVENVDVVVGESVTPVASLPPEECTSECKAAEAPAEPEPVATETPAPVEPEPLVSVSEPSPPEPEPAPEPELAPEPEPVAPEPVPEPEPTSNPEAEVVEAAPEPIPESVPSFEALEQQTDMLTQESLPEPLIDLGVPDANSEPADEPADIPVSEECQEDGPEETSESLEKPMEVEAAGDLVQLVSDVNEESVTELLQNLELKGNDLVADHIPTDVKIPDDGLITNMSTSAELM